jgi:hypothetical protein
VDNVQTEKSHLGEGYLGFGPRRDGDTFPARMLTVDKSDLRSWNICALFQEQNLSTTRTKIPKKKDQPKIKTVDCTHLDLDFSNEKAKVEFELKLLDVMTRRLGQLGDAGDARGIAEREARTPIVIEYPQSPGLQRRGSYTNYRWSSISTSTSSTAPRLDPLGSFASIKLG